MPSRSSYHRRLVRTIVLGAIAVFAGIAWLARELGMDTAELLGYAGNGLLMVGVVVVLSVLGAAAMRGLKRLRRRD